MTIQTSSDVYQPDESTFLCGFRRVRRYGTTQTQSNPATPSSHVIYQVKSDDTLEGIALKHNCSVSSIVRANKLWSPSALFMKEFIRIPVFNTEDSRASTPKLSQPSQTKNENSQSESIARVSENSDRSMTDILQRIDKNIKSFKNYEISSDSILYSNDCN